MNRCWLKEISLCLVEGGGFHVEGGGFHVEDGTRISFRVRFPRVLQ